MLVAAKAHHEKQHMIPPERYHRYEYSAVLHHLIHHPLSMCTAAIPSFGARVVAEDQQSLLNSRLCGGVSKWGIARFMDHVP